MPWARPLNTRTPGSGFYPQHARLKHTDNLSKTLQSPKLTAADAHSVAELTCDTLEQIRNEESFGLFWEKLLLVQEKHDVSLPTLPRKRIAPERLREGSGEAFIHDDPKQYYRAQYFEALDLVLNFVKKRFDQPAWLCCIFLSRSSAP